MTCRACHKQAAAGTAGMCPDCQAKFGLPERWPASRRLPRPCMRCGGVELIRAIVRERGAGDWYSPRLAALGVTFRRQVWIGARGQEIPRNEPDLREPVGILETYVCRACGYTEWYVIEPERVPIGPEYATELVAIDDRGPER